MNAVFGLAGLISIAAALILMYVVLKKYTYPAVEQPFFSDPTLFMLFAIGLVEGTVLFEIFNLWFLFNVNSMLAFPIAICFAAIAELMKLVTLNLKRFAGKSDTIFYGFGLGIGIGAAMGVGMLFSSFSVPDKFFDAQSVVVEIIIMLILLFVNSASGLVVGEGVARYKSLEYTLKSMFASAATYLIFAASFNIPTEETWVVTVILLVVDLIFISFVLYRGAFVSLPRIVDDVIRQEKRNQDILNSQKKE